MDIADRSTSLRRSYGTTLHLRNSRNETACESFSDFEEMPNDVSGHRRRVWVRLAQLLAAPQRYQRDSGISENDSTRSALYRYVTNLRDTGEYGFDLLQIAAVAYLRNLDELHDDRGARLAADQALAECLESRRAHADT